jgi:hypothetical protein
VAARDYEILRTPGHRPDEPMTTATYMSQPDALVTRSRSVAGIILWCLRRTIRIHAYLFLSILAPVIRAVLSGLALLGLPSSPQPANSAVTSTAIAGPIIVRALIKVFTSALSSIQQSTSVKN